MSDFFYADQLSPDAYVLDVTPGVNNLDLTTVASASFKVRRAADDSEATWTATMSLQTATTLRLTYQLLAGDIDTVRGNYAIYARLILVTSGKPERTQTRIVQVKGKYEA